MTSPSSSAWMRMIPCMAGWAGPTPTWMFWLPAPVPAPSPSMNSRVVVGAGVAEHLDGGLTGHHRRMVAAVPVGLDDGGAEPRLQLSQDGPTFHHRRASRARACGDSLGLASGVGRPAASHSHAALRLCTPIP